MSKISSSYYIRENEFGYEFFPKIYSQPGGRFPKALYGRKSIGNDGSCDHSSLLGNASQIDIFLTV